MSTLQAFRVVRAWGSYLRNEPTFLKGPDAPLGLKVSWYLQSPELLYSHLASWWLLAWIG